MHIYIYIIYISYICITHLVIVLLVAGVARVVGSLPLLDVFDVIEQENPPEKCPIFRLNSKLKIEIEHMSLNRKIPLENPPYSD